MTITSVPDTITSPKGMGNIIMLTVFLSILVFLVSFTLIYAGLFSILLSYSKKDSLRLHSYYDGQRKSLLKKFAWIPGLIFLALSYFFFKWIQQDNQPIFIWVDCIASLLAVILLIDDLHKKENTKRE